jgi:hypothetical protein
MSESRRSIVSRSTGRGAVTGERTGAMLAFVGVAMVVLMGFLAMTLDVGAGARQRRIAQTAADAAAIGGAIEIYRLHPDLVVASAQAEAIRNGFESGDVTVNYPPASGPHAGNASYVEVLINKTIPTIFGSIFNIGSLNIATRAVAGSGSYSLNCIYSLDPSGPRAIEVANGGELTTNCGITINSTNPNALDVNSSGTIDTQGGGIAISGGWTGNKAPVPTPATGTVAVENPLKALEMPTIGACDHTGLLTITKDTTLNPGVYCGGIDFTNKSSFLNPGTYIMVGGGLSVRTSGVIIGYEVTLVNTIDTTGVYNFGPFDFGTGCKATLTAPTSGYFEGILMFQDPLAPANVTNTFACASDDGPELTGTLYFPTQTIYFDGSNSGTTIIGSVIAKNVEVSGKVDVVNQTSNNTALQRFTLVE